MGEKQQRARRRLADCTGLVVVDLLSFNANKQCSDVVGRSSVNSFVNNHVCHRLQMGVEIRKLVILGTHKSHKIEFRPSCSDGYE